MYASVTSTDLGMGDAVSYRSTEVVHRARAHPILGHHLPRDPLGRLILDSYARMSDGFEGKEINVASQFETNDRVIDARGAAIGQRFSDPLSAWKRNVRRPEWEQIVERMRTGQSAGVVVYHIDRFLRQPRELERLLDVVEEMGCVLVSGGSERKLDSADDRFILRIEVAQACKASDDTRRRVTSKLAALRELGILPGGGPRAFGWPGWEPANGKGKRVMVSEEKLAAECAAIVEAFDAVLKGTNLTEIAKAWNEAGLLGFYRKPWTNITVRQVLQRGRHAGRIEHEGEVVGLIADHEPTVKPEVFDQVQMMFASRRRGRPVTKRYLASGIVRCSLCKQTMVSRPRYPGGNSSRPAIPTYRCCKPKGCGGVQIDQGVVDDFLRTLTINRLSDPAVAGALSEVSMEADLQAIGLQAELDTARASEVAINHKLGEGTISLEGYEAAHSGLARRIVVLETQLGQLAAAAADLGAVRARSELSIATEWGDATVEERREMVIAATRLVHVEILPAGPVGRRIPNEERFRVVPL